MKFSQIERGINNFSAASRGDQKFNRVFHPVSTTPLPRELKNDNSLRWKFPPGLDRFPTSIEAIKSL